MPEENGAELEPVAAGAEESADWTILDGAEDTDGDKDFRERVLSGWRLPPDRRGDLTTDEVATMLACYANPAIDALPDEDRKVLFGRSLATFDPIEGATPNVLYRMAAAVELLFPYRSQGFYADFRGTCYYLAGLSDDWGHMMWALAVVELASRSGRIDADCLRRVLLGADQVLARFIEAGTPGRIAYRFDLLGLLADRDSETHHHIARTFREYGWRAPGDQSGPEPAGSGGEINSPDASGRTMTVLKPSAEQRQDVKYWREFEAYRSLCQPIRLAMMPDIATYRSDLISEFPWASDTIDQIIGELLLAARLGRRHFHLPPIILYGRPGVGKSRLARRLSDYSAATYAQISGAGSTDNRMIAGTARGWHSAQPCLPLVVMRTRGWANPLIVVEDLDKAADDRRTGRISDTLLLMTDRSTNGEYFDECLLCPADLSAVSWVITANDPDRIDPLLRSRCTVIEVPRPRPEDFPAIITNIVEDLVEEFRVAVADLPTVPDAVIDELRCGFEGGTLQARQLATLFRKASIAAARAEREQRH